METRELIKKVRRIELVTRRLVNLELAGQYHSVFKGRGMDFDEVQPYAAGDDVRFIDWNVSARTGALHVKHFVEERELTVLIVVDASSSMAFGSAPETKRIVAAQIAALLAMLAVRNNDRVGLAIFDEDVDTYIPPKKGKKHVLRLVTSILGHQPRRSQTDLGAALRYVTRVLRRKAIVFVVSDFLAPDTERDLRILARRHDVVPVVIEDARERDWLPTEAAPMSWFQRLWRGGLVELVDLESQERAAVDLGSARQGRAIGHHVADHVARRDRTFQRLRLDTIHFDTKLPSESDYVRPLVQFFRRRSRRA